MEKGVIQFVILFLLLCFPSTFRSVYGLKFKLDREECFSQVLSSENYSVWGTHGVVDTEHSWKRYYDDAVKLSVIDPTGNVVYNSHGNLSWKFELRPSASGVYLFCFINSSPRHLPVEFDLNIFSNTSKYISEHAKHVNEKMSKRAITKAVYESVALVAASVLQIFLLRRLFEKKFSTSMV
ncbi:putative transmembrane emp24 domain-containing protein [Dioscorea sansibarensis]